MMTMHHIKRCAVGATALLTTALGSCVYDNAPTESCGQEEKKPLTLSLNLTVPASSTATRGAGDPLYPATEAEDYIDIENADYQICLYDKDGNYVSDRLSEVACEKKAESGSTVTYTLTANLHLEDDADMARLDKFKVMVLANWRSFERSNTRADYEYPDLSGYTITGAGAPNIFKEATELNYSFAPQNANYSWTPSNTAGNTRGIPMFGISDELDLQYVIEMSHHSDWPSFSVQMLRAVAKVEVVEEEADQIGSVSLAKLNKSGRFIPEIDESKNINTGWNDEATQILTPSLPAEAGNIDKIQLVEGPQTGGKRTWIGFIPEMDLTKKRPDIVVYAGNKEMPATPFNNYKEDGTVETDPAKFINSVLRNHIYRFKVMISDKSTLQVKLDVLPWEMEYDDNPWYFDNPEISSKLVWFPGEQKTIINQDKVTSGEESPKYSYNGFVEDTGSLQLIMCEGITDYAEAQFKFTAPKHCTWHAELVFLEGRPDAFYFVDASGNAITTNGGNPSGTIDGTATATIRIKNKYEQVSTNPNEMRLVIFIDYPDGISREVKVVDAIKIPDSTSSTGDKTIDNYTIVQNQTDIY